MFVAFSGIVESGAVNKDEIVFVFFVVQDSKGINILGDRLEAASSACHILTGEGIDDLERGMRFYSLIDNLKHALDSFQNQLGP
jgi:hypothetical protein